MGLKKANACISLLLVVVFLAHSVYELIACLTMSFDPTVVKVFGITVAAFVSVHVVLSVISIFKYQDSKKIDYPKLNKDDCISPLEIYQKMEIHGLYEINDQNIKNLYPSCSEGLIEIEY